MTREEENGNIDVLQNIEFGLSKAYEKNSEATDAMMMIAIGKARIAVKQLFGYGKGQNGVPDGAFENYVVGHILEIAKMRISELKSLSPDEFDKCITKVGRSVDTHRAYGPRGYYEFIKNYV
jgi:hypothetical protein